MAQSISSAASAGVKLFVNTQKDPLLLRASASASGAILTRIPRGAAVTVLAFSAPSGWTAVMYGKTRGYAASQYLATSSPVTSGGATKTTTTSPSSSTTNYPISPAPTAAGITDNTTSMASDKLKTALKIGGIVAGVGLLAFGAYKIMQQKKKAEAATTTTAAIAPARRSGGKALNGIGGSKRRKGKRKSKKTKKQKSAKAKNGTLRLR